MHMPAARPQPGSATRLPYVWRVHALLGLLVLLLTGARCVAQQSTPSRHAAAAPSHSTVLSTSSDLRVAGINLARLNSAGEPREASLQRTRNLIGGALGSAAVIALQGVPDELWLTDLASLASSAQVTYRGYLVPASGAARTFGFLVDTRSVDVTALQPLRDVTGAAEAGLAGGVLRFVPHAGTAAQTVTLLNVDAAEPAAEDLASAVSQLAAITPGDLLLLGNFASGAAVPAVGEASQALPVRLSHAGLSELRDSAIDALPETSVTVGNPVTPLAGTVTAHPAQERAFASAGLLARYGAQWLRLVDAAVPAEAAQMLSLHVPVQRMAAGPTFSGDFGSQTLAVTSNPRSLDLHADTTNVADVHFFVASITGPNAADFQLTADTCTSLAPDAHCSVTVTFTPSALGTRSATLLVPNDSANQPNFSVPLTGVGVSPFALGAASLDFGSAEITTRSAVQTVPITNASPLPAELGSVSLSGDFAGQTDCPATVAPGAACHLQIAFAPQQSGTRAGAVHFSGSARPGDLMLTGTGTDFSIAFAPASGGTVAGTPLTAQLGLQPISGFSRPVVLSCTTDAPAASCSVAGQLGLAANITVPVTINTTSRYIIVGFDGLGVAGRDAREGANNSRDGVWIGWLASLAGLLSTVGIARSARQGSKRLRYATGAAALILLSTALQGCGSRNPPMNASYTPAGTYQYTVTVTDGVLTRSSTFSLTVRSH